MNTLVSLFRIIALLIIALFILRFVASAQQPGPKSDIDIDAATRIAIIETLVKELNERYVFPDVAKKVGSDLRARLAAKEYDSITSSVKFAERLTNDLRAIAHDKHLGVRFSFQTLPARSDRREPSAEEVAQRQLMMRRANFGFDRAERMDGNIGYIELRGFMDPESGKDTVAAAIAMVANTDALIFDLRQNGGGSPSMVALVCSYLFGDKPVHLNDLYFRPQNETTEFWTDPKVPGKKFVDKDVYVLTSSSTFSGGEEFANNLKTLKRATIVGETTGGGANPGGTVRLNDHFAAFVPTGRAINPITKTNWEGTGVEPDVKVPKELALKTAYLIALSRSIEKAPEGNLKEGLKELIERTKNELDELKKKDSVR